jgi:hypothetical protein
MGYPQPGYGAPMPGYGAPYGQPHYGSKKAYKKMYKKGYHY